jgi:hypothetical protein
MSYIDALLTASINSLFLSCWSFSENLSENLSITSEDIGLAVWSAKSTNQLTNMVD